MVMKFFEDNIAIEVYLLHTVADEGLAIRSGQLENVYDGTHPVELSETAQRPGSSLDAQ